MGDWLKSWLNVKIYKLQSQHVDLSVTPNHKMWIKRRKTQDDGKFRYNNYEFMSAKDCYGRRLKYKKDAINTNLDIEFITIINGGYNGLTFNGFSTGNISNCNFISNAFGIQIMDDVNISVSNSNFINNGQYGIAVRGTTASFEISYSNFWENSLGCGGYNENC